MNLLKILFKRNDTHEHSYGQVEEDGYQYCVACNYAHFVSKKVECYHKWKIIDEYNISRIRNGSVTGKVYFMRCENCGEMKSQKLIIFDK